MSKIEHFDGEYRFLSNFWPAKVVLDGMEYATTEHAYQAAKTLDMNVRKEIQAAKYPNKAKKLGQKVALREDWEGVKLSVMEDLLRQKFQDPELKKALLDTGDAELIEGNFWHDTFWGVCDNKGKNQLGRLLMKIRSEIK